jgi:hypothetical protein
MRKGKRGLQAEGEGEGGGGGELFPCFGAGLVARRISCQTMTDVVRLTVTLKFRSPSDDVLGISRASGT